MRWLLAVVQPLPGFDLVPGDTLVVEPGALSAVRVEGPHARTLPSNYGRILGALEIGALCLLGNHRQISPPPEYRPRLRLVA